MAEGKANTSILVLARASPGPRQGNTTEFSMTERPSDPVIVKCPIFGCGGVYEIRLDQLECPSCGFALLPYKFSPKEIYGLRPDVRRYLRALHDREASTLRSMSCKELSTFVGNNPGSKARKARVWRATMKLVRGTAPPVRRAKTAAKPTDDELDKLFKQIDADPSTVFEKRKRAGGRKR
jgi:hypothetical protein